MGTVNSADGTTIAYERTGSGPPLVLVHGATVDRTTWVDALPFLEERFTVYAMDRRGLGESGDVQQERSAGQPDAAASGDAAEYSLEREAEDVVALVDAVEGPVDLLGHSFGGLCCLEAALRTDGVRRLVLYEPALDEASADGERSLAEIRTAVDAGDREGALVAFYREFAGLSEAELEQVRSLPTWSRRVDAVDTVVREAEAVFAYEFDPERCRELTAPTLLLVGEKSPDSERRVADLLRASLPDARVAVLADQRHVAYRTAPKRFAAAVAEFLTEAE